MRKADFITIVLLTAFLSASLSAQTQAPSPQEDQLTKEVLSAAPDLPLERSRRLEFDEALRGRDYKRAETILVDEAGRDPKSQRAAALFVMAGGIFFIDGQYLNSAIAYKKAEAIISPGRLDQRSRFILAMAYIKLNRRDWARDELEKLSREQTDSSLYLYWLARLDYDAQEYQRAIAGFKKVIELDQNMMRAYDGLGLCYDYLGKYDEAIGNYHRAVELNRRQARPSPWPHLNLAISLIATRKLDEAESQLRESLGYDAGLPQAHYQLGQILEKQGQYAEAIQSLNRAVALDPAYPEPHYTLGRIYQRLGDSAQAKKAADRFQELKKTGTGNSPLALKEPAEQQILQIQQLIARGERTDARRLINEIAKQFPADAGLNNLLGVIDAQEGNFAAAESSFKLAIMRRQKFTGASLNLARLYQEHSALDPQAAQKALAIYQQVLQYEPDNVEANYQSATLQMRQGAYQSSLDHLSRLPAEARNRAQALSISCADYAGLGDRIRADQAAIALLSSSDFSEPELLTILPALTGKGRDDLSVKLLEGLLTRGPLSPQMTRHLALAYERMGRLAEARKALERTVAGDSPVSSLLELARIAHKQDDYQGALGYLAHARDLEPNNASLLFYFGLVCLNLNLIAEARNAFDQAVKIEPDNPSYNYVMGAASSFRHDPAEAIPYFEKYIQLKPQDPRGKLALGAALFRAKNYDAAAETLKEAVKYPENAATAQYYLGSIARQQGRLTEAIRHLEESLKAKPDYPDALAELGHCYLIQKDYELAGKYLQRALQLNPHHYTANFTLLTLYTRTRDERETAQAKRFEEIKKLREEKSQEFLRMVDVRPYPVP